MRERISSNTRVSQPGRAVSGRFRQTSQIEEPSDALSKLRTPPRISVVMGHVAVTVNPDEITADTNASQAAGCLLAKTMTALPSRGKQSAQARNALAIPRS